jgi:S-adenosylmethionine uptake transporter
MILRLSPAVLAAVISTGSMFFISLMMALSKLAAPDIGPVEQAFWRNLLAFIPTAFLCFYKFGYRLPPMGKPKAMLARSLVGNLALITSFGAYGYLPLADANAIILCASLILIVLAHFFLGEHFRKDRTLLVLLGLFGGLMVLQPSGVISPIGTTLAIISAFAAAGMRALLKYLGRSEKALAVIFYSFLLGIIFTGPYALFYGQLPAQSVWLLLGGMALCGLAGQYLNTLSYQYGEATFINVIVYTQMLFVLLFDWLIFAHSATWTTLLGGALIAGSNIWIILRERKKKITVEPI